MKSDERCADCGKLLALCRCDEEEYVGPPGAVRNRTLGTRRPLRARTLEEKYGDDPLRYGPLWREVRAMTCFARRYLSWSKCGLGYAPASAHHLDHRGHMDVKGLLPVCSKHHDRVEEHPAEVDEALSKAGSPPLDQLGRVFVELAAAKIRHRGEMTDEIEEALREAA